ncbi:MAG: glycosyltransferase, partial [Desulfovibrio sp.]|nr:glycosyltransferase [Desulfovibrio sp.]
DPRLRVISLERNRGVSAARNIGLGRAGGEYVAFVDSDDVPQPDFCRKLLAAAQGADADIAKGNYAYRRHDRIDYAVNQKIREAKTNFYIQCCSAIYRAAMIRKHDILFSPELRASEDILFAFTAACRADRIAVADDARIVISARPGSASFGPPDRAILASHYRALEEIVRTAAAAEIGKESFNHVLASLFALFLRIAAKNRNPEIRAFVAARNRELFNMAGVNPRWDSVLFRNALPANDKSLYACLEKDSISSFFTTVDKTQAQHCRMLRSRAHAASRAG